MSNEEASNPKPTNSNQTGPVIEASAQDEDSNASDSRFIWLTQPPSINHADGYQPPAATNGTYSDSLTRLQTGYLRAIGVLKSRNKALKQELDNGGSRQADEAIQSCARLEQQNGQPQFQLNSSEQQIKQLRLQLNSTQEGSAKRKSEVVLLNASLEKKNATIEEKNTKIMYIEDMNRRLKTELDVERKKNRNTGRQENTDTHARGECDTKTYTDGVIGMHAYGAAMDRTNTSSGGAARTAGPAQKKMKHLDPAFADANNPYVVE